MDNVIRVAVVDILTQLGIEVGDFVVEHPADMGNGDYACNVAMVAAKGAGMAPRVLALQIVTALEGQIEYVEKIEIAGPGFINFYLSRDFFIAELFRARELGAAWGRNDSEAGRKIIVEYTDPNPFKAFHIGHLFTNTVGEAIARLGELQGADICRANYQGDVGLHVAHAIYGMQQLGITADASFTAADLGRAYALGATAYRDDEAAQPIIRDLNKKIYDRTDPAVNVLYDAGRAVSLAYFESIYDIVGTKFAAYFFESQMAPKGKELILNHPETFLQSDGAYIFRGEDYGLHTRVFLNKEGLPTYEAKELALAKAKDEYFGGYDHSIISTAKEINEYFKVLKKAMSFVYPELAAKTEHLGHGMVRLTTGKMSSRTGDVILATDFIDDIAAAAQAKVVESGMTAPTPELARAIALGAIKYTTLKGDVTQDSVFDTTKALSFEGDSGPYLQYTYARIKSVLDKAVAGGVMPSLATAPTAPYLVEQMVYQFEEVVAEAWEKRAPHLLVTYLTKLAGAFNTFYAHEKIADISDAFAPYKAAVAEAVATTLKNGLWALGIEAPERL